MTPSPVSIPVSVLATALGLILALPAEAARLSDLDHYSYEVLYTNPVCGPYSYDSPVASVGGGELEQKPEGAYCKASDGRASSARKSSPQYRLIEWIRDPATQEIFFAYLSFSNGTVGKELCAAANRGVKITFVLDAGNQEDPARLREAEALLACGRGSSKPRMELRGHVGGLGYAHNKVFLINPSSEERIRLVYSSGNLSAGVSLHHENWHFITADSASYFMQAHLCLMNGMLDHADSAREYAAYIQKCRSQIATEEEEDIRTFFVPGEGDAATETLESEIRSARSIWMAAHRFSYSKLIGFLSEKLTRSPRTDVRLVTDDDTYWVGTTGEQVGANMANEYKAIQRLERSGLSVRWMETNHGDRLLHHNKFLVFDQKAVFTGAGNLTGDAFTKNLENFYLVRIPEVVKSMREQHRRLYEDLATSTDDMPAENVLP